MGKKLFEKGNPGKQKGTVPKTTKQAKELFIGIMEGQTSRIEEALDAVYKKDKKGYLEVLTKFYPYFIPKKTEVSGALDLGGEIVINTVITNDVRDESKG